LSNDCDPKKKKKKNNNNNKNNKAKLRPALYVRTKAGKNGHQLCMCFSFGGQRAAAVLY
jgi:hypothetical protein